VDVLVVCHYVEYELLISCSTIARYTFQIVGGEVGLDKVSYGIYIVSQSVLHTQAKILS